MNVTTFIAKKYFFSNHKKRFIHYISLMSMVGVCLGSMALVVVLSVFNGLEDLNRQIFKTYDPDLKVYPVKSKNFFEKEITNKGIDKINGINYISKVIEDNALAKNGDAQMIVLVKGFDSTFQKKLDLKKAIVDGDLILKDKYQNYAFVGGGVMSILGLRTLDYLYPLELWYPKNDKLNVLNPEENISTEKFVVSGAFVLEQQFDNHVYIPLKKAEELFGSYGKLSNLEITLENERYADEVQETLQEKLGENFIVKNRDQQNEALFKAIKVEKLFIFLALFFIIGIASFNIFFSLSMLVIDKQDDIKTLASLGATKKMVRNIFIKEGAIIALLGAGLGFILGLLLCYSQIYFGWINMGMQNAIVDAYPIKVIYKDIFYAIFGILIITFVAAYFPAKKALTYF